MTPKLRVLISSTQSYPPTEPIQVNSSKPTSIETQGFKGHIWVFVKDYNGDNVQNEEEVYFDKRAGMTYGIVVRGRFLNEINSDDILFGNVFENPIRDSLPWGTSIATKFMYFIDPTLELDIYADKPWALSPALASMSYLSLEKGWDEAGGSEECVISEDALDFLKETGAMLVADDIPSSEGNEKAQIAARRKWFGKKENREKVKLGKDTLVGLEFCNGLLDFNTLSATLPQPFHLSVPLLKYWDGQPVTYVCQRRQPKGDSPVGSGGSGGKEVFFSVGFEIVDEKALEELEKRGGKAVRPGQEAGTKSAEGESDLGVTEETSDDVD